MSREVQIDFDVLKSFINGYDISQLLSNNEFLAFISQQHKKYFSYLTFIAEIENFVDNPVFTIPVLSTQLPFIKESCSDTGTALFSTFHGSYKASKLLLRSSIETFLKGYFIDNIPDINEETSMYEFFRRVKSLPFSQLEPQKSILESLHGNYKLLCKDVHTASNLNMVSLSALNYFPTFNNIEASKVSNTSLLLISSYVTLLCLKFNQQYHLFHFKNKKIIISSIRKEFRQTINNIHL